MPRGKRLAWLAVSLALAGCSKSSSSDGAASTATVERSPSPPPAPPPKSAGEEIRELPTFAAALAYAKPHMDDSTNKLDPGAVLFAAWAVKWMRWSDVSVKQDETTPALVMKDSDEERGKRVCFTGKIIEISVSKNELGKFTEGLLAVGYYDTTLFHFLNVGSSGTIVEGNDGVRFCGVVTGRFDYSNSGGGTGHAIQVVGMWDLPENKRIAPVVTPAPTAPAAVPTMNVESLPKAGGVAPSPPGAPPADTGPVPTPVVATTSAPTVTSAPSPPCGCAPGDTDCALRCSIKRH